MTSVYWLIAFVVLVGIEAATLALTTVWFAGGAIAAFLLSLAGADVNAQLTVFVIVSFVLLIFTRPWAVSHVNRRAEKTNADSLVGRQARVTEEINNIQGTGTAVIGGQEWTARTQEEDCVCPVDEIVEICAIQGVKLIVKRVQKEITS
ncbi:MAG: NfeD family protein [Hungatella sp.]|nr:NfeD family protein [Hungatella sp.]